MNQDAREKINYVEFPARNIELAKAFYAAAFGWAFQDYGPEYCAITNAGLDGGFYQADLSSNTSQGSVLVVLYSADLEQTQANVIAAGGRIVKEIFSFPGGRRFHFSDPNENELAVWSDQ